MKELIIIRNRIVEAELVYVSDRGDYKVYRYNNKTYRVDTPTG